MTNFTVYEGNGTVREELESNPDIKIGDTIEYLSNNQQGYEKYEVILGDDGEKSLKLIDSYDHQMGYYDDSDDEYDNSKPVLKGGKRKTHKKRKVYKRKTHKRKTHKKRKTVKRRKY